MLFQSLNHALIDVVASGTKMDAILQLLNLLPTHVIVVLSVAKLKQGDGKGSQNI